ncbi:MAG TPA: hypothetical protein VGA13_08220 [Acidimicrobiales bacterium]
MRDAILAAAVTGRLVPQDPTDTPAAKLLADLGIQPIEREDEPLAVPDGWAPARVRDIAQVGSGWLHDPRFNRSDHLGDLDEFLQFVQLERLHLDSVHRPGGTLPPSAGRSTIGGVNGA